MNEADRSLVFAATVPDLAGARIALINFPAEAAADIAVALQQARCSFRLVDIPPNSGNGSIAAHRLDLFDVLVMYANSTGIGICEEDAITLERPWLMVGSPKLVLAQGTLHGRADDVLFAPYQMDDLLFRVARTLRRRCMYRPQNVERQRGRVLVADDDPAIRRLLRSVLASHNLEYFEASDGRTALALTREMLPDLLVLDLGMPLLSGFDVLRLLRADRCTRNIKIMLLTSSTEVTDIHMGSELGADEYVGKPFNHLTLARKIRSLVAAPAEPRS